jgi:hypothetical protein
MANKILDWIFEKIMPWFGLIFLGFAFIFILVCGYNIYKILSKPSPQILLNKDTWECTQTNTVLTPLIVGKTIIQQPQTYCTQYSQREHL